MPPPSSVNPNDEAKTAQVMDTENRRSFVKKSLATSMTFTFSGLIRAHGEEGGETTYATTVNPEESTYATTDSGGTTTFNPEESTVPITTEETTAVPTTSDPFVSLQKQIPDGGQQSPDSPDLYLKTTPLQSDFGILSIKAGNDIIFQINPWWKVEIKQSITADHTLTSYPSVDCAANTVLVQITLNLFPPGNAGAGIFGIPDMAAVVTAFLKGFYSIMDAGNIPNAPAVSATTWMRSIVGGVTVSSGYGISFESPNELVPLVIAGPRYGDTSVSSHGYWLTLSHQLNPEDASSSVNVTWITKLSKSSYIDIVNQIENAILTQLNAGPIQSLQQANPNKQITVGLVIPELPLSESDIEYSQLVVAFDLEPTGSGQSCPLAQPTRFGTESEETPIDEPEPADNRWDKEDINPLPPCPPPPLIA